MRSFLPTNSPALFDQRREDIERTAAEANRTAALQQKLLRRQETEGAERHSTFRSESRPLGHVAPDSRYSRSIELTVLYAAQRWRFTAEYPRSGPFFTKRDEA